MIALFNRALRELDSKFPVAGKEIPRLFRDIPLDIFGQLLTHPPAELPGIKKYFPSMPSPQVQSHWTGTHGDVLLSQSTAFIKSLVSAFQEIVGRRLEDSLLLDYGCGWGRLIRLLYKFVPHENIYAVDPWPAALELCRDCRVKAHFALSDAAPNSLPFECTFDVIMAFSVFTHLDEETTRLALKTLRSRISNDGLLAITIRPKEYWDYKYSGDKALEMKKRHDAAGFAFTPFQDRFGDTSMSLEYLARCVPGWNIAKVDWNAVDSLQLIVFLKPAS